MRGIGSHELQREQVSCQSWSGTRLAPARHESAASITSTGSRQAVPWLRDDSACERSISCPRQELAVCHRRSAGELRHCSRVVRRRKLKPASRTESGRRLCRSAIVETFGRNHGSHFIVGHFYCRRSPSATMRVRADRAKCAPADRLADAGDAHELSPARRSGLLTHRVCRSMVPIIGEGR